MSVVQLLSGSASTFPIVHNECSSKVCSQKSLTFVMEYSYCPGSGHSSSLYTSWLFDITKDHLSEVYCHTDDTQLYLSFRPDASSDTEMALAAMSDCTIDLRAWMIGDNLIINDGKTKARLISCAKCR